MKKVIKNLKYFYNFYRENFPMLFLVALVNIFVLVTIKDVPYINWFLDSLPGFVAIVDMIIFLYIFKPSDNTLFILFIWVLVSILLSYLYGVPYISKMLGILSFTLMIVIVIRKFVEAKKELGN